MCIDKECEILNHMKQYRKDYYLRNKQKLLEINNRRYQINKDILLEKKLEYKELHKDEIQKKYSAKTTCICGGSYTYANKTKHLKTKKHLDYITANLSLESSTPLATSEPGASTDTIINNNGSSS